MKGVKALKEMAKFSGMSPQVRNQQAIWHRGKANSRSKPRSVGESQVLKLLNLYDKGQGRYKHHERFKSHFIAFASWNPDDPVNTVSMDIDNGYATLAEARQVNGLLFFYYYDKPKPHTYDE